MTSRDMRDVIATQIRPDGRNDTRRTVPAEAPVAIEFNGIGYAVMMMTPTDIEDFAYGFALSEQIARNISDILGIEVVETEKGWLVRLQLAPERMKPVTERMRMRVTESSCGLCGLENLEQVLRPLPRLETRHEVSDEALFRACKALPTHQPLNAATGGVHAAAFCWPDGTIELAREDVGRHSALDKLIGALARAGQPTSAGFFLLSSRCSYELVEKTVIAGAPLLVTVSTATTLGIDRARSAGLDLVALARGDAMLRFAP